MVGLIIFIVICVVAWRCGLFNKVRVFKDPTEDGAEAGAGEQEVKQVDGEEVHMRETKV